MLNKEEIIYNSRSLVETWLDSVKKIKSLWIEMCGDGGNDTYPCTLDNCGEVIGGLLYDNNGKYRLLNLYGDVDGVEKIIGSVDIT